jgi:ribosomal protein L11 methyltransferase
LPDQNWTRVWMDQFQPMRFGQRLWICPSGHEIPDPTAINILLDPGLAFGTGTHPTTRLCLEWLEAHPPKEELVIDYGCGSGILSLAAKKLGASLVFAVDHDPQALQSTRDNSEKNGFTAKDIVPVLPNDLKLHKKADLIMANILANPLMELAPTFSELIRPKGLIVLSGILETQCEDVFKHYLPFFELVEVSKQEGWICAALKRNREQGTGALR